MTIEDNSDPVLGRTPAATMAQHRDRTSERGMSPPGRGARGTVDRVAILADARFWSWLQDEDDSPAGHPQRAQEVLCGLLTQQRARLTRTLWFTDQDFDQSVPGLQVRRVPSNAQDRGITMLRAMAHELLAIADHGAVDRVLLISDDDRLVLAVDEAQRRGLQVDVLVDAETQDLRSLWEENSSWASLLQAADRVLVLGGSNKPVRLPRHHAADASAHRPRNEPPSAEASGIIEDEILSWWDDETPDQRDHWRLEIQGARGIPQELDRQLLLRISRRMGHPLSPAEKTLMRQQVRQQMGVDGPAGQPPTTPTGA